MLTLPELERAARILEPLLAGHRIQTIVQPDPQRVVLETYGFDGTREGGAKRRLLLCAGPDFARVSLLDVTPRAPSGAPAFAQFLRAHVRDARIEGVRIVGNDRVLGIRWRCADGRGGELLLQIFGRRSNIYAIGDDGEITATLQPLATIRPELEIGAPWRAPENPPPQVGEDRFTDVADPEYLAAVETHYVDLERERSVGDLHRQVNQAIKREERLLTRKLLKLEAELASAGQANRLQREGDLLKTMLPRVSAGQAEAVATDFETGEEVRIALDPARSPAENLEALFKRYRKAVRQLSKAGARDEAVRAAQAATISLRADFDALADDDIESLEAFAARPEIEALLTKSGPKSPPAKTRGGRAPERKLAGRMVPSRLAPRRYGTSDGLEIWVGRSDQANDFLTTRLARGNDLFFHLDGAPGSHVILRTEGRGDPPSESLLEACELAVHFSKARNATRADVHVVPIKNVRKPRGAKRGLVHVHGGKTVHLRRIPNRLERVLAARVDD